ncbi:MAG TPA: LapA family protein [Deltaproteobacteria bacterium]|nr:LapA family protein [Deltaproteobacteria bacterium]
MRYLKIVFVIVMLLVVIIFCVQNTESYVLSFAGYRLAVPLQMWVLLAIFFVAGMVPILVLELPRAVTHYRRMRPLKAQISSMEKQLENPGVLPADPPK